jgi:hypothetical protein
MLTCDLQMYSAILSWMLRKIREGSTVFGNSEEHGVHLPLDFFAE